MNSVAISLSVFSISITLSFEMPHSESAFLITSIIALLELIASFPPRKIETLDALKQSPNASEVTLGRDS